MFRNVTGNHSLLCIESYELKNSDFKLDILRPLGYPHEFGWIFVTGSGHLMTGSYLK